MIILCDDFYRGFSEKKLKHTLLKSVGEKKDPREVMALWFTTIKVLGVAYAFAHSKSNHSNLCQSRKTAWVGFKMPPAHLLGI